MSTIEKIAGRDMTRGSGILDQSGQAANDAYEEGYANKPEWLGEGQ